jgi:hypothetical protein
LFLSLLLLYCTLHLSPLLLKAYLQLPHCLLTISSPLFQFLVHFLLLDQLSPEVFSLSYSFLGIVLQIVCKFSEFCVLLFELFHPEVLPADYCVHLGQRVLFLE